MSTGTRTWGLGLAAVALALAGCGSSSKVAEPTQAPSTGAKPSTASKASPVIQVRSVTSSATGSCRVAPLQGASAGRSCSIDAKTTYQLGPAIADLVVTKAMVTYDGPGDIVSTYPIVRVQLDKNSTLQLSTLTKQSIGKQMAFLIGGKVVQAAIIGAQISDGDIAVLPGGSASDTQPPTTALYKNLLNQVESELGAR